MATPETPIPFTVGDQERLGRIEGKLDKLCVVQGQKIKSLEDSRRRWYTFLATLGSGSLIALLGLGLGKLLGR